LEPAARQLSKAIRKTKMSFEPAGFLWKAPGVVGKFAEVVNPGTVPDHPSLIVVLRSILVPLKAAVLNLLSIGAAYGVIVAMAFRDR
jgi:hypothetical protein